MSDSIKFMSLPIQYFTVNKKFEPCGIVCFSLDLHFYGNVHLTNWGRFNTYNSAVRFAADMMQASINDPRLLEYLQNNPAERIEVQGECSAE